MAQLNLSLPSFQGLDLSDEKQLRKLTSYLYRLDEQLRYVLNNLGEENLSDSLRAIINAQTDATVLDEMTGQVQRLSTQIVQTAQAISLKADKETLDALGETLGSSIATLEVTAKQIRTEVSNTASGLQSQINQQAGQITLSVQTATNAQNTANSAAGAAAAANTALGEKLGKKEAAVGVNTQNGIVINQNGVYVEGQNIDLRTSDGDEYVHISEAGVSASSISAPNVMPKYTHANNLLVSPYYTSETISYNNCYRSLQEAFDQLSGKVIDKAVSVLLDHSSVDYGSNAKLQGAIFLKGLRIGVNGSNTPTLAGAIRVINCVGDIQISNIAINTDSYWGIDIENHSGYVLIDQCKISGNPYYGIYVHRGSNVQIQSSEIYNAYGASVMADFASHIYMQQNKGNSPIVSNKGSIVQLCGPQPSGNASSLDYQESWGGKVFTDNVRVDQGSAGGSSVPVLTTATYTATSTGSYKGSGSKYRNDVAQGWYDSIGRIRGCMWFDNTSIRNAMRGRTVLSATIRLAMRSNVGRGTSVTVELSGTYSNSGASSAAVTKSYGVLGTANPGETVTFTLPTAAVTDLVNGTINGLMLYSSDTGAYKERDYSKNYAVFDGAADSTPPQLTIVYQ